MDRLSLVIALALAAAGCEKQGDDEGGAERSRVNAVAKRAEHVDPAELCDVFHTASQAPPLVLPPLADGGRPAGSSGHAHWTNPAATTGHWRWINVWATWCPPCVEELPRLGRWQQRLKRQGNTVDLTLISADDGDEPIAEFRRQHPGTPETLRLAEPDAVGAWLKKLGVSGASLPLLMVVDPHGRLRCVRASAVGESDFEAVRAFLATR